MKVKLINTDSLYGGEPITLGKTYKVTKDLGNKFRIIADDGSELDYFKIRFEIIEESLDDQLKAAKQKVLDIEKEIEANKPKFKVGQRYKNDGCDTVWIIIDVNGRYTLACIGGCDLGLSYSGSLHDKIEDVFHGNFEYFTAID